MLQWIEWIAMITGVTAALIVSAKLGARKTGIGFIIFTVSSISWVYVALSLEEWPLFFLKFVLTGVNLFGIYRWLIVKSDAITSKPV